MPPIDLAPLGDEFLRIAPEIILSLWGLIVLLVDVAALRKRSSAERCHILGYMTIFGAILALGSIFIPDLIDPMGEAELPLFRGTLLGGMLVDRINALLIVLLIFVIGLSMTWSFTEHWGEYYSLLLWSAVGMMLLIASEELLTLFLTLEMMTICLYIITAFEKDKRRSAEGGLKYFVYGSVSSALFLFGLSLLYGLTGTTRLEGIGMALSSQHGTTSPGRWPCSSSSSVSASRSRPCPSTSGRPTPTRGRPLP
jgi:NADH-quinone oxidoreductase subunit N